MKLFNNEQIAKITPARIKTLNLFVKMLFAVNLSEQKHTIMQHYFFNGVQNINIL